MIKEIVKAKEGYEKVVGVFDELIDNIEQAKAEEIALIEEKYAERLEKYNADRNNYVEITLVEEPDPVEDDFIETESTIDGETELPQMGETASVQF